jgi:hypothetical protein
MGKIKIKEEWKKENGNYKCPYCNKEFSKKGIPTHIWRKHGEGKNHNALKNYKGGKVAWNKGLTQETSMIVKKYTKTIKDQFNNGRLGTFTGRVHDEKTIKKMKENPDCGGYRKGSGRGKSGWYKGYWCDSTYELCWLIYNLDKGIIPIRNKEGYEYIYENETHTYYPDFIIDDTIYELKGYETEKDLCKYKSVGNKKLVILKKDDLKEVFEYVKYNYTTNYESLYA